MEMFYFQMLKSSIESSQYLYNRTDNSLLVLFKSISPLRVLSSESQSTYLGKLVNESYVTENLYAIFS